MKWIEKLNIEERNEILDRSSSVEDVLEDVRKIVDKVRKDGDKAIFDFTKKFDDVVLDSLKVKEKRIKIAKESIDSSVEKAIRESANRIKDFHSKQVRKGRIEEAEEGINIGRLFLPLESAGVYIPGGRASYPSTALMTAIPAKVAGIKRVIACTPPNIDYQTLVAFDIAGVDEIYKIGGAQAISAMAYGSDTIDPVDIVVGPGNIYVAAAKRLVRDKVKIDFEAGPSEVGIITDSSGDPEILAAEMIAQMEHDPESRAILTTSSESLARKIENKIDELIKDMDRRKTIRKARKDILVGDIEDCINFMKKYAPEHLLVVMKSEKKEEKIAQNVSNAGSVFLGINTPVAAGDYATGTNHVLPTGGMARFRGGLSVDDFVRNITVQRLSKEGLNKLSDTIQTLAKIEGLDAHARSVELRKD